MTLLRYTSFHSKPHSFEKENIEVYQNAQLYRTDLTNDKIKICNEGTGELLTDPNSVCQTRL